MNARYKMILAMLIFGSIGLFVKSIEASSILIALIRGSIGCLFLIGIRSITKNRFDWQSIHQNWKWLLCSGIAVGANWVFLFQAYRYTSIANATIIYYLAPIMVCCYTHFFMNEKMRKSQVIGVFLALIGMIFLCNPQGGFKQDELLGLFYAFLAACFYATIIISNKKINDCSGLDLTCVQLFVAALVLFIYVFFQEPINLLIMPTLSIVLLIVVGIVHTGIAYYLYFSSLKELSASEIAISGYIDPMTALFLSVLILAEPMNLFQACGALLILFAGFIARQKSGNKVERMID